MKSTGKARIMISMEVCPAIEARLVDALLTQQVGAGAHLLAAVSGGADSVALLRLLVSLKEQGRIRMLSAAHFHHGLRGEEADGDEAFVRDLCRALDVPLYCGRRNVRQAALETGETIEEAARTARYGFLRQTRESCGANYIVTAHNMDDQAETVLLHLLRGSGIAGLCAMREKMGDLLRPMLRIQRREIEAYLNQIGQPYRTDGSNASGAYTRNRIRHELLPLLRERFNPSVTNALWRLAEHARQDEDFLSDLGKEGLLRANTGVNQYDRALLRELPEPVRIRALRLALERVGALFDMEQTGIDRLNSLLEKNTGSRLALPNGQWAYISYGLICFGPLPEQQQEFHIPFSMEGTTPTPQGAFTASFVAERGREQSERVAYLDADRLPGNMVIRLRAAGDRIRPLGMTGSKPLKEYFIDKKLPRWQRSVPLLCSGNKVIWIPGCCIGEAYKIRPDTKRILRVEYLET